MTRRQFSAAALGGVFLATPALAVNLPRPAGELAIAMPNGGTELLSKYRGKDVVLAFILST